MTAAPFCAICGAAFEAEDQYCANCGAKRPERREDPTSVSYSDGPSRGSAGAPPWLSEGPEEPVATSDAPRPRWMDETPAESRARWEREQQSDPQRVSMWDRHPNQPGARTYAQVPSVQAAASDEEQPGWIVAVIVAAVFAIGTGVFLGTADDVVDISSTGRVVYGSAYTGTEIVGAAVASFIVWLIVLRAFFALLSIERSLRGR